MPDPVNIRSIAALEELRQALLRLRDETRAPLALADHEIRSTRDWLTERRLHWQQEIERSTEQLRQTEAALARCRHSSQRDRPRSCRALEGQVHRVRHALQQAEEEARTVQRWTQTVEASASTYERRARILSEQLGRRIPVAATALSSLITSLNGYTGLSAPGAPVHAESSSRSGCEPCDQSGFGDLLDDAAASEANPPRGDDGRDACPMAPKR